MRAGVSKAWTNSALFGANRNLKVRRVRVTTDRCSNADQNVRCVRTVFGGGLIDGASRDSTQLSTGRFVLHGYPICNNLPMCGRYKLSRRKQLIEALQQRRRCESRGL
jgi:hypothetical protein